MRRILTISLAFILGIFASSCEEKDRIDELDLDNFEVEDMLIIGQTMKNQIESMPEVFNILDEKEYEDAYAYLGTLLHTLKLTAVVSHRDSYPWTVTIVQDDDVRTAFTLPGGHIYVYTGLLKFLQAEHELIAILGNEIAYADQGMISKALRNAYGGVLLGDIKLGKKVEVLPEIMTELPSLQFTKEMVFDADQYSIRLVCPFQYDISGLKGFVERAHQGEIEWINSKKWDDYNVRLSNLEEFSMPCGEGGVTNFEQYQMKIRNFLPR